MDEATDRRITREEVKRTRRGVRIQSGVRNIYSHIKDAPGTVNVTRFLAVTHHAPGVFLRPGHIANPLTHFVSRRNNAP